MLVLSFFISPGSAEALVRLGGKMKYLLIAYFLGDFCAKNYQNQLIYAIAIARQNSDSFLGHSVEITIGIAREVTVPWCIGPVAPNEQLDPWFSNYTKLYCLITT